MGRRVSSSFVADFLPIRGILVGKAGREAEEEGWLEGAEERTGCEREASEEEGAMRSGESQRGAVSFSERLGTTNLFCEESAALDEALPAEEERPAAVR